MLNGFTLNFKPLDILTEEQIDAIERGFLAVLEETGMKFENKKVLEVLERGGCKVDYDDMIAKFPPSLVMECIRKCPSSFRVKAREPKNDIVVGGNKLYFGSDPGMQRMDLETGEPRDATREEFYDAVKVYDALENLHIHHPNSPHTSFAGVLEQMVSVETYAARTRNSSKTSRYTLGMGDNDIFSIQIAQAVGARPLCCIPCQPPLSWNNEICAAAMRALDSGFPVVTSDGDTYGATAPATLAGSLVHACAEATGGLVFLQLYRPGIGSAVMSFTSPQNMRSGAPLFGNIGVALHDAAYNQIWRRYGVPRANLEPGISNSKRIDFQNGYEKATLALISALSGCNYLLLFGTVYGELESHPVQAILDDDIAGIIGRFIEGIEVNDETLAIDLINKVGIFPGFYLNEKHTRNWWQKEQFIPRSADLATLPEWISQGKKTCIDHAKERMKKILATHQPTPLTPSQEADIERILEDARSYYKKRRLEA